MKIAYVTINVAVNLMQGGVGTKIKRHMTIWKEMGHSVRLFCLTPDSVSFSDMEQFIFGPASRIFPLRFFSLEISRIVNLGRMLDAIKAYQPDVIYFRFGLYTFPLQRLFKIAPVFMEVNSNDIEEYKTRGVFFYWLNRLTRGIAFYGSKGLVPVSEELARINEKYDRPVRVVSNGVDLSAFAPLPAPKHDTPVLTAIGSPGMSWQGMDKLFALARQVPDLTIHIIGDSPDDFSEPIPVNLHIHGFLDQAKIREIFSNTDVVFGQLALHRKNMQENPALKIREALAYGIPVIMAHHDADLADLDTDCILFIPNTEDNLVTHGVHVRDFAYKVMGKRIKRELVSSRIDQRLKEQQRLSFFEEILSKRKS